MSYRAANGIGAVGSNGKIINCYNIGKLTGRGYIGNYVMGTKDTGNDENCYYLQKIADEDNCKIDKNSVSFTHENANEVVESLNRYINENSINDEIRINEWKTWKLGEDGYPTFE